MLHYEGQFKKFSGGFLKHMQLADLLIGDFFLKEGNIICLLFQYPTKK